MPDTFSITLTGTRPDEDGRQAIEDEPFTFGIACLVQSLVDGGWPRESIQWSCTTNDAASGDGDGTDYAEVTLPEIPE